MNKIINLILSGLLWRRYKFFIVTLVLTVVSIVLVGQVHQDYIEYQNLQEQAANVGFSFVIKWIVWACIAIAFYLANHFYNQYRNKQKAQTRPNNALQKLMRWKTDKPRQQATENIKSTADDPFDNIRKKDRLRSYADVIIEAKKPSKD